jgi:hypothetical protein
VVVIVTWRDSRRVMTGQDPRYPVIQSSPPLPFTAAHQVFESHRGVAGLRKRLECVAADKARIG